MKKRMSLALVMVLLFVSLMGCGANQTIMLSQTGSFSTAEKTGTNQTEQHQIIIQGSSFIPLEFHIKPGDTVTWVNRDTQKHTITSIRYFQDEDDISHIYIGESFDSGDIDPGKSYARTFSEAGSFWYISLPLHNALPIPQYQQLVAELSVGAVVVS
jgi:plastocyanin